jgi:hypothetical protein
MTASRMRKLFCPSSQTQNWIMLASERIRSISKRPSQLCRKRVGAALVGGTTRNAEPDHRDEEIAELKARIAALEGDQGGPKKAAQTD